MKTLADRLADSLAASGRTKAELARACGVAAASVNDWFSGKTKSLKGTSLIHASNFLGVRSLWLAEGKGPMRNEGVDTEPSQTQEEWPFHLARKQDYDRLTKGEKQDLDRTVARFIAGCLSDHNKP